ncbi:segregation and condensation protein A [Spinactinospora alkalitolerans]|uniref:Segregation and condensation protein A n=1 Tax=Spinactinospora alkalitolerans TaxID=687207 RepID=A0A852TWV4_9ACTN|nr:ScpA family protein [Spinactinospora alkalitolerans]NYE48499.1 segregation and condensation protein A [Spinactinospora alkalitolerans]
MTAEDATGGSGFQVHLDNFEGPFDLLLGLISKHKLDITEVALSKVTDEFIAYIKAHGDSWDLDQASHFLLVAATLLDLKAARLLPRGDVEDEADLALLEARDLLFARLLQYRAYKEVSAVLAERLLTQGRRFPRAVTLEPRFAEARPDVFIRLGPQEFAALAVRVLTPKEPPSVPVTHIHQSRTSVREQGALVVEALRARGSMTFAELTTDCTGTFEVVARFLALLELYRAANVGFDQPEPLGELLITWTGGAEGEVSVSDDYGRDGPVGGGGDDDGED